MSFVRRLIEKRNKIPRYALGILLRPLIWIYLIAWAARAWLRSLTGSRSPRVPGPPVPSTAIRRPRILFVCPYPIYPPNHGGGVRIYNLVKRLSRRCDIYLLMFSRFADDPVQRAALEPLVRKLYHYHWIPRGPHDPWGIEPKGAQLWDVPSAHALINEILASEPIDILQLEYTEMGQFGRPDYARVKVVLSEIDVTFRTRLRRHRAGINRRYAVNRNFGNSLMDILRELRFELRAAARADQIHVMSEADGTYLGRFLPSGGRTIRVVPNAVDVDEFTPPSAPRSSTQLLFIGNFDHLPNQDALDYLMTDIWPSVRSRVPEATLQIAGARAGELVYRYDGRDGVSVIGEVPDTIPHYQQCAAMIAPIRAGSGTRLKILEALACATPVVTTTIGAEGIEGVPGEHFLIGDTTASFIDAVCSILDNSALRVRLGEAGRRLAETRYSWEHSADAAFAGYSELLAGRPAESESSQAAEPAELDISIVIPTLNGGAGLEESLAAIRKQKTQRSYEIICVDSGSAASDVETMKRHGANVIGINRSDFNHGLTRDLGASHARGRVLVFINQDAVPAAEDWLETITAPLFEDNNYAAVQGGISEVPEREKRFYWDSCGHRFYFTRESKRWIERYYGIGFSTVNAAIRRDVWQRHPFGYAQIMEDKKWQREIVDAGYGITLAPDAVVYHTHNYGMKSLLRRCESEGFGWRTVGETYTFPDMLKDLFQPRMYADLLRGLRRREIRTKAELFFPWLRPLLVFRGNRWSRSVKL